MIKIRHLTKKYNDMYALKNLNLDIEDGEFLGVIGENGAGKTTMMKICMGLIPADNGDVFLDGVSVLDNHELLTTNFGYVPDSLGDCSLTCLQFLSFFAEAYEFFGKKNYDLCMDLLKLVKLEDKAHNIINFLSRGQKQRLCIAKALIHDPKYLFLDEPASGIDPAGRFELKEILKSLSAKGKTIIMSSHILPELAEMCTSIVIIDKGTFVAKGNVEEIFKISSSDNPLEIIVDFPDVDRTFQALQENPFVQRIDAVSNAILVEFTGTAEDETKLLSNLVGRGIIVNSFRHQEIDLDAVFAKALDEKKAAAKEQKYNNMNKLLVQSAGPIANKNQLDETLFEKEKKLNNLLDLAASLEVVPDKLKNDINVLSNEVAYLKDQSVTDDIPPKNVVYQGFFETPTEEIEREIRGSYEEVDGHRVFRMPPPKTMHINPKTLNQHVNNLNTSYDNYKEEDAEENIPIDYSVPDLTPEEIDKYIESLPIYAKPLPDQRAQFEEELQLKHKRHLA